MQNKISTQIIEKILSQKATEKEIEEFENWCKSSPKNQAYFDEIKIIWEASGNIYKNTYFNLDSAKTKIKQKLVLKNKSENIFTKQISIWGSVAASVLLIIGSWFIYQNMSYGLVYEAQNQVKQITLPDSSQIWLNKHSTLKLAKNFNTYNRRTHLHGEAFFKIKRNEKKPFRIITNNTVTKVLGTSFNILENKATNSVDIIVTSGKVSFLKRLEILNNTILTKGESAKYLASTKNIDYSKNENENYLSWINNTLKFNSTPLPEVCSQLSKHFDKEIILNNKATPLSLTGEFKNESLNDILSTLQLTLDIKIDTIETRIVINN